MTGVPDPADRSGGELDGYHIGHLPAGIRDLVSDFASEWEGVSFATRVWERRVEGGHRVDLRVHVLRGDRLGTFVELRDFLAEYHERDPADWAQAEFRHGEAPGLIGAAEAFWLDRPGLAVNVLIDSERFVSGDLSTIVQSITAAHGGAGVSALP
ncbi:hypothetical protein [Micromonospora sp. NBC_00858]|uniref:hypothetical protein n=1 Tax=Micromonospora sp. NBC_00858 TaxID=2975979 RepID=UPI00386BC45A|nr:hypothetical protein OG990_02745 [Micromonospora sp. NBC_00858]